MSVLARVAVITHRRLSEERPTNILTWKAPERHVCPGYQAGRCTLGGDKVEVWYSMEGCLLERAFRQF